MRDRPVDLVAGIPPLAARGLIEVLGADDLGDALVGSQVLEVGARTP
jgi:hypothetical protein